MKRRSKVTATAAKARRSKSARLKRHGVPKDATRLASHAAGEEGEVTWLSRELREAREQQTAASEVLQVISSSPGDVQPVFAAMLEKAVRICDATFGNIFRWDGEAFQFMASHKTPPAFANRRKLSPIRPSPTTLFGRLVATKSVVHTADLAAEKQYVEERRPTYVEAVELGGIRAFLVVPMLKNDELIGAIGLFRHEVRPFTDKQIEPRSKLRRSSGHRHRERAVAQRIAPEHHRPERGVGAADSYVGRTAGYLKLSGRA